MWLMAIPVCIFILDTRIKRHVDKRRKLGEKELVCKEKIILTKYYNKGAALNFLAKTPKLMTAFHTLLFAIITVFYGSLFQKPGDTGLKVSLGMILGGGLSNLTDRLRKGHVIDYVSFHVRWKKLRNIVFNVSDFFIFAGALTGMFWGLKKR